MKMLNYTRLCLSILGTLALFASLNAATEIAEDTSHQVSVSPPTQVSSDASLDATGIADEKRVIKSLAKGTEGTEPLTSRRFKRQVDSSTAVVGLRIIRGTNAQDLTRVRNTARRVARSVRRFRRSIDGSDVEPENSAGEQAEDRILKISPHPILNSFMDPGVITITHHRRLRPTKPTRLQSQPPVLFKPEKVPYETQTVHYHEQHEQSRPPLLFNTEKVPYETQTVHYHEQHEQSRPPVLFKTEKVPCETQTVHYHEQHEQSRPSVVFKTKKVPSETHLVHYHEQHGQSRPPVLFKTEKVPSETHPVLYHEHHEQSRPSVLLKAKKVPHESQTVHYHEQHGQSRPPVLFKTEKVPSEAHPLHYHEHHVHHEHKVLVPVYVPHKVKVPVQVIHKTVTQAPYVPPARPTPSITNFITITQRVFNTINFNFTIASRLQDEYLIQTLQDVSSGLIDNNRITASQRFLVVNEAGVTCPDVCDTTETEGVGYGTLGICTPNFCQCDFSLWQFTRYNCPGDTVFDPILKGCSDPKSVVLCNDAIVNDEPEGYGGYTGRPATGYSNSNINTIVNPTASGLNNDLNSMLLQGSNQKINNVRQKNNANVPSAVLSGALRPANANTQMSRPDSANVGLRTQQVTSTLNNDVSINGNLNNGNQLTLSQQATLNNLSPEQSQMFAALAAQTQSQNYATAVNNMVVQQLASAAEFGGLSTAANGAQFGTQTVTGNGDQFGTQPATPNGAQFGTLPAATNMAQFSALSASASQLQTATAVNQLREPATFDQDPNQYTVAAAQEVFSFSQVEQPYSNTPGLVPPLVADPEPIYGQFVSAQAVPASGTGNYQGQNGQLTAEQIQQLKDMAKYFVAQNSLPPLGNSFYGR